MKKTVVELFAGVGGFRVGLNHIKDFDKSTGLAIENGKWDFVWANQWEPSSISQDAFNCYIKRFGDTKSHVNSDIMSIAATETESKIIPEHSLLVGGFPCQDYSVARSKSGEKGIEGKKGVLFWAIRDILIARETPFVLLENVDRLLKSPANQRGRDFGIMLRTFYDLGYNLEWRVINAADYGRFQRRRRVFIFAWKNHLRFNENATMNSTSSFLDETGLFAKSFSAQALSDSNLAVIDLSEKAYTDTVEMTGKFKANFENSGLMNNGVVYTAHLNPIKHKQAKLRDILDNASLVSDDYFITMDKFEKFLVLKNSKKILRKDKKTGFEYTYSEGTMEFPDNLDKPSRTMLTSETSLNRSTHVIESIPNRFRYLTPIETEKLNDFPSEWTNTGMSNKRRYFMMGNALVTGLISLIEPNLAKIIEEEN